MQVVARLTEVDPMLVLTHLRINPEFFARAPLELRPLSVPAKRCRLKSCIDQLGASEKREQPAD